MLKRRLALALALALLPLALSLPCFFGLTWAAGDLLRQFHPWKELGRQALMHGRLPLWNPTVFCGMPLAGNFQSGLFYPLHFYFYFLPFAQGLGLHLFTHFFLSATGFYALARSLKISERGSLLAALAWSANAFLLARIEFMSALSAYAWTPWILAALLGSWRWPWAALFIGLQALAGYPLELGYSFVAAILLMLGTGQGSWKDFLKSWPLGLALGSAVLLPGLELWSQSSRAAGLADASQNYALNFSDLKAWFLPVSGLAWAKLFSISLATLALAPLARGRRAFAALLLCLAGLCLSFGIFNPTFNRHPSLALSWLSLGLALLTGLGAEKIRRPFWAWAAGFCLLIQPLFFSSWNMNLVSREAYEPAPAAVALSYKITPERRFLLSPEVQEERNSGGPTLSFAWSRFPGWLQANTAAPLGLKDANGYDPLAPAAVVAKLNALSFPKFPMDNGLLDELGVEALVTRSGTDAIAISKRQGHVPRALFLKAKPASAADLKSGIELGLSEASPEELHVALPASHGPGWIFLNDTFYPGWRATADGRPVAIEKGLDAFRLVEIAPADKEAVFKYRPLSVYLGLALSLFAGLLSLSLLKAPKIN